MSEPVPPPLNRRQGIVVRFLIAFMGLLFTGAMIYVLLTVKPTDDSFYPKCISYKVTGTHCPGCGMTRSVHALLNGHITQAFAYNPLITFFSPYLFLCALRTVWHWVMGTEAKRSWFPNRLTWPVFIVLILYWVLRNVPYYPFNLLAPHELSA